MNIRLDEYSMCGHDDLAGVILRGGHGSVYAYQCRKCGCLAPAPETVESLDFAAIMKLVRAYGRECVKDGQQTSGRRAGTRAITTERRRQVESALRTALARVGGAK